MAGSYGSRGARSPLRLLPAFAQAAVLFLLSAQPDLRFAEDDVVDLVVRKSGHAGMYAVLAALIAWGLGVETPRPRSVALVVGLAGLYAVTDEVHQAFVPGRTGSVIDVGVDLVGVALGVAAYFGVVGRQRARATR